MALREKYDAISTLECAGISVDDAVALRRISMTLHRWYERECGESNEHGSWGIERDDPTCKPFIVYHSNYGSPRMKARRPIPDRERGAEKRLAAIMARYPRLSYYLQTDPRGAALYILRPGDVPEGAKAECCYSNGIMVY